MNKYTKILIGWTLAATFLAPALSWAHGAVDIPVSRAVKCQATGGFWQSQDGSAIVNRGCRDASLATSNTPAEWAYPAQQWNEVAHIPFINNPTLDQIKAIIKDEQICAAGDPKKAALDHPTPNWSKTNVTPGQPLTIRLIGTAPHVPSTAYAFVTNPGFNTATDKLKWSDLTPLGQPENLTVANTNWQTPPVLSGASGFFLITRPIPGNASGNGLIVVIWVRNDPAGEFFISCSDVKFQGGGVTEPLTNIGPFINADMSGVEDGDSIHFRIFGTDPAKTELVDIRQPITRSNLAPAQWGKQIADKVISSFAQIGELNNQKVTFNDVDPLVNTTNVTDPGYTQAMAIIRGGGSKPEAEINGPDKITSGQTYTYTAKLNNAQGTAQATWAPNGLITPTTYGLTITGQAVTVASPTKFNIDVNIRDGATGGTYQASKEIEVLPAGDGGTDPAYVEGTKYAAGARVTNVGKTFECLPWPYTDWCAGARNVYGPGEGRAWEQAWKEVRQPSRR